MTTFTTYATATFATGNIVVVQSAENMLPGLPITFLGNTFGNVQANATYYIGNITFGFPTSNITLTSLPGGSTVNVSNGSGNMITSFKQGGQLIIPTVAPGEPLNQAFDAINVNFDQIFAAGPVGSNIQIDENTIYTLNTNGNLVLNPNGIGNIVGNAHVVPDQDRVRNLGAPLLRWNTIYAQNIVGNVTGNTNAGGSNGQIQYNANGILAGANGFTFLANTSSVSIVGTLTAGNVLTPGIVSSTSGIYGDIYTTMIDSGDSSAILVLSEVNMLSDLSVAQSLQVDQNISATGNISGNNLIGDNVLFGSGVVSGTGNIYANKIFANIQGNIDAAGNLYEIQFNTTGDQLGANANFTYDFANNVLTVANGNIVSGNVLAGTVSATGNITANYYFGNGSQLTGITADNVNADDLIGNILSANVLYSNLVTVGNLVSLSVVGNTTTGNLDTAGAVSATGNVTAGNVLFGSGIVSGTGNIYANKIFANIQGNIDAAGNLYEIQFNTTGDQLGANANFTYDFANNVFTVANGNIATGNVSAVGNISANYFFGNGSQLTGIDATSIQNGNSNVRVAANANVTVGVSGVSNVAVFTPAGVDIIGNVSATGNISANYYFGNGSQLTGVAAASVDANALTGNTLSANVLFSSLTTVGTLVDLSVAGTANVGNLVTPGVISATGNIDSAANISGANLLTGGVVSATGTGTFGNILTGGTISATSTIQGGNVLTPGDVSATGSVTGGNIYTGGVISAVSTITGGNLATAGTVTSTGTITGGNIATAGFVTATGNIDTAGFFNGDGGYLSNIQTSVISNGTSRAEFATTNGPLTVDINGVANILVVDSTGATVTGAVSASGTVTGGNLLTAGEVSATGTGTFGNVFTGGIVSAAGDATAGNLFTGGVVSAAGNAISANVDTGNISATGDITTDGTVYTANVTGNTALTLTTNNGAISLAPTGGNITVNSNYINNLLDPQNPQDAATKQYVDDVAQGLNVHDAVAAATTGNLDSATGGTVSYNNGNAGVGANLVTTGTYTNIDGVAINSANTRILVKNEANTAWNGVYVYSNSTVITRAADFDTVPEVEAGDFMFVLYGNVNGNTGWVQTSNVTTIGTDPITFTQFSGAGQYTANTAAGLEVTGTVFSAKVDGSGLNTIAFDGNGNLYVPPGANLTTPNIGNATGNSLTLTGNGNVTANSVLLSGVASVAGNVTAGNVDTSGQVTATGNVTGGNVVTAGQVTATGNVTGGNVVTAGQVTATGDVHGGNLITTGFVSATGEITTNSNIVGGNLLTSGVMSATGTVTGGNVITAGFVTATGDITGGNVLTAGFVTATGNGTFGNVFTGGIISATSTIQGGNVLTPGEVSAGGSLTGGNIYTGGAVSAVSTITGGNIVTAGFVTATGNITGGNINTAGAVSVTGNVTAGNVLFDAGIVSGTGNIYAGNIFANITGNIDAAGANTEIQFNDNGILGASAGFTFNTVGNVLTANGNINGANLFTSGQVSATGNVTGGNIATAGEITATGTVTGGNITTGGSVTATGNVTGGNLITSGSVTATGTVTAGNIDTAGAVSATGNVTGGNILFGSGIVSGTGNIYANNIFANISGNIDAAGNINEVQFNGTGDILTASAGFTFDPAANVLTANGNINGANLFTGGSVSAVGDIIGGNITTTGQVSGGTLDVTGNAVINGDLAVNGNITYVNVTSFNVEDPIIGLGRGANDSPLTFNDGKDRGEQLWYFNTGANVEQSAFIGYDNSANKIIAAIDVTIANEIVTVNDYGTFEVGNLQAAILSTAGNVTAGNLITGGLISATGNATAGNLITGGSITATGNVTGNNIFSGGEISATGNITAPTFVGNLEATTASVLANVTAGNVLTGGIVSATGNITGGNVLFGSGIVSGTGNIYANNIFANISGNIDAAGNINEIQFNTTGDILGANANFTYDSANNVFTVANGNIVGGNVLANTNISATGNITGNNIVVGNITIPSSGNVTLGNVNINDLAEPFANSDAATKFYVDSVAANVLPIISNQTITPDGISNTFVLNQTATDVGILLTINGITQTPATNYTVSGNSLTMAETPLSSDIIQVRYLSGTQVGGGGTNYANANVVAYGESGWAGNIVPAGNLVYNLGNSTNRWNDLYLSGNTIYLDSATIGANGTDITFSGNITAGNLSTTGNVFGNVNGYSIGYKDIPQISFGANAVASLTDAGKHYYSTTAGNLALTLPDNNSVAFPTGATLTIVVNAAGNVLVNQGTGVSLYQAGSSATGNRVVGAYGLATVMKVAANTWVISGTGVY